MTTYTPKLSRPIVAVRLKNDIMAPKGDWLAIDPADDSVVHLSNESFMALYGKQPETSARRAAPTPAKKSATPRTAEGLLLTQGGRVFFHLRRAGEPVKFDRLCELVGDSVKPKSVSSTLSAMGKVGVVRHVGESRGGRWEVTDRGCVIFDRLGMRCFTDYRLPVPAAS